MSPQQPATMLLHVPVLSSHVWYWYTAFTTYLVMPACLLTSWSIYHSIQRGVNKGSLIGFQYCSDAIHCTSLVLPSLCSALRYVMALHIIISCRSSKHLAARQSRAYDGCCRETPAIRRRMFYIHEHTRRE